MTLKFRFEYPETGGNNLPRKVSKMYQSTQSYPTRPIPSSVTLCTLQLTHTMETLYVSFLLILNPSFHLLPLFLLLPVLEFLAHIIAPLVSQRAVHTVLRFSQRR
jgi:hypothetical protein